MINISKEIFQRLLHTTVMQNLNSYDPRSFQDWFSSTELFSKIQKDFDLITWDIDCSSFMLPGMTPRQYRGTRIFSAAPFYYINQIGFTEKIYDIGCGWNIYKKYLPNLIGISGEPSNSKYFYGDEHGLLDDQYAELNQHRFDNVMSMNSLHFIPLSSFPQRVQQLKKVTKPKGKIFITMNLCHMISSEESDIKNYAAEYIRKEMSKFSKDILCFELDDANILKNLSEGTLRFVMENNE